MSRTTKLPILLIFISLFFTSYQAIKAQDDEQTADQELMDVLWSGDPEARKSVLSKMSIDKALELMRLVIAEEKSDDFRRRTTARLALAAIRDELGKRKEAIQPLIAQFRSLSQRQSNDEEKPTDELELLFYVLLIK
ncbi:MAG TPA: hypothetical protein VN659_06970, partial [Pyrinomonadaceae bacterium]|nr:hypothetical protein [Pyrinomonadaceae bacterium]